MLYLIKIEDSKVIFYRKGQGFGGGVNFAVYHYLPICEGERNRGQSDRHN